jgi:hypothetical protein
MLSRTVTLSAVVIVLVGCAEDRTPRARAGQPEASATAGNALMDPAPADVAHVVCEKDGVSLKNPVVRAQRDGVHIAVENRGGVWGFEFRHVTDPNVAWHSGPIDRGTTYLTDSSGPGEVLVACLQARDPDAQGDGYHDENVLTAGLTLVDPDDLHVPWEPACGFGEQFRMKIDATEEEEPTDVFRRVPGVEPSDEFRTPKYPESDQYWPTVLVFRDGTAVARLMAPRIGSEWELLINACPRSGITKT